MAAECGARFTSWTDVVRHLSARYRRVTLEGDFAATVASAGEPRDEKAEELPLTVAAFEIMGALWIKVSGVVGSLRALSTMELLENNASAAFGVFATRDGVLIVRQTLPLAHLDGAALDELLAGLAELVGWARRRILDMGGPLAPWTFPGARGR